MNVVSLPFESESSCVSLFVHALFLFFFTLNIADCRFLRDFQILFVCDEVTVSMPFFFVFIARLHLERIRAPTLFVV